MSADDPPDPDDATADIPDPQPIEIDNVDDTHSPYDSLNGTSLDGRERIGLARLEGDSIGRQRVRAHTGLQLAEGLVRSLDVLAEERDATLLESVELRFGMQLLLADEPDDQASMAAESPAGRAVERLITLITVSSVESLAIFLRTLDDEQLMLLERLMRLLVSTQVDLSLQARSSQRPIRLTSGRAATYLAHLARERADQDRPVTFVGRLDGVIAPEGKDKREFRLTLREPWHRRRVIRGSFDVGLTEAMRDHLLQNVVLGAEVSRHTHGERRSTLTFHAVTVRPLDASIFDLQLEARSATL